jgi:hypothetical protein
MRRRGGDRRWRDEIYRALYINSDFGSHWIIGILAFVLLMVVTFFELF